MQQSSAAPYAARTATTVRSRRASSLALSLPRPTQAERRAQLQRLRLMAAGHFHGLLEAGLRLRYVGTRQLELQHLLKPRELGLPPPFLSGGYPRQDLSQDL
jgi:hypothetical protein